MRKIIDHIIRVLEKIPMFKTPIKRVLSVYSFQKRKHEILALHNENIKNGRLIQIDIKNENVKKQFLIIFKNSFGFILQFREYKIYSSPAAVILLPKTIEEYLKLIGPKSRNMIRKAEKSGYISRCFTWDDYLEDIYAIHTSSKTRQGRQMDKNYREFPKPIAEVDTEDYKLKHIGVFRDHKVVAYIELAIYGNFATTRRILGNKEDLKFGIMNLLFKEVVNYGITENAFSILNYLTMENQKINNLSAFKFRVGFREYTIESF